SRKRLIEDNAPCIELRTFSNSSILLFLSGLQAASLLAGGGIAVSVLSAEFGSRYLTRSNVKSSACRAPLAKFSTDSRTVFCISSRSVSVLPTNTYRSLGTQNH